MTRRRLRSAFLIGAIVFAAAPVGGQGSGSVTPNTRALAPGERSPAARVADVAWIAGHWQAEALGGLADEWWAPPMSGAMMGMFRLQANGAIRFYEILTIAEHESSLVLRLKHFNADLTGWEEKNDTVDFPLVQLAPGEAWFDGLTFRREDDNTLVVYLAIKQKDGSIREERFRYRRVTS